MLLITDETALTQNMIFLLSSSGHRKHKNDCFRMKTIPDFFLFLRHMFYKVNEVYRQNSWVGAKSA